MYSAAQHLLLCLFPQFISSSGRVRRGKLWEDYERRPGFLDSFFLYFYFWHYYRCPYFPSLFPTSTHLPPHSFVLMPANVHYQTTVTAPLCSFSVPVTEFRSSSYQPPLNVSLSFSRLWGVQVEIQFLPSSETHSKLWTAFLAPNLIFSLPSTTVFFTLPTCKCFNMWIS